MKDILTTEGNDHLTEFYYYDPMELCAQRQTWRDNVLQKMHQNAQHKCAHTFMMIKGFERQGIHYLCELSDAWQ